MARTNELPNIRLFHLFSLTGHSSIPTPRPICTPSDLCKASAMPSNLKYRPRVSGYWTKAPQSLSMEAKSVVVWSPITWWANTGVARAWKNTGNTRHASGYWTWSILKPQWLQHCSFWVPRVKSMSKVSWPSHKQLVPAQLVLATAGSCNCCYLLTAATRRWEKKE